MRHRRAASSLLGVQLQAGTIIGAYCPQGGAFNTHATCPQSTPEWSHCVPPPESIARAHVLTNGPTTATTCLCCRNARSTQPQSTLHHSTAQHTEDAPTSMFAQRAPPLLPLWCCVWRKWQPASKVQPAGRAHSGPPWPDLFAPEAWIAVHTVALLPGSTAGVCWHWCALWPHMPTCRDCHLELRHTRAEGAPSLAMHHIPYIKLHTNAVKGVQLLLHPEGLPQYWLHRGRVV
jgi:hypothetical protein